MKINEIINLTKATIYNNPDEDYEAFYGFTSDLMSDVLLNIHDYGDVALLISGLSNVQLIRTAEILDIRAIILVRGKKPSVELIKLSKMHNIILLGTDYSAYKTTGVLFSNGLKALF